MSHDPTFNLPEWDLENVREDVTHPVVIHQDVVGAGERLGCHGEEEGARDQTAISMEEMNLGEGGLAILGSTSSLTYKAPEPSYFVF